MSLTDPSGSCLDTTDDFYAPSFYDAVQDRLRDLQHAVTQNVSARAIDKVLHDGGYSGRPPGAGSAKQAASIDAALEALKERLFNQHNLLFERISGLAKRTEACEATRGNLEHVLRRVEALEARLERAQGPALPAACPHCRSCVAPKRDDLRFRESDALSTRSVELPGRRPPPNANPTALPVTSLCQAPVPSRCHPTGAFALSSTGGHLDREERRRPAPSNPDRPPAGEDPAANPFATPPVAGEQRFPLFPASAAPAAGARGGGAGEWFAAGPDRSPAAATIHPTLMEMLDRRRGGRTPASLEESAGRLSPTQRPDRQYRGGGFTPTLEDPPSLSPMPASGIHQRRPRATPPPGSVGGRLSPPVQTRPDSPPDTPPGPPSTKRRSRQPRSPEGCSVSFASDALPCRPAEKPRRGGVAAKPEGETTPHERDGPDVAGYTSVGELLCRNEPGRRSNRRASAAGGLEDPTGTATRLIAWRARDARASSPSGGSSSSGGSNRDGGESDETTTTVQQTRLERPLQARSGRNTPTGGTPGKRHRKCKPPPEGRLLLKEVHTLAAELREAAAVKDAEFLQKAKAHLIQVQHLVQSARHVNQASRVPMYDLAQELVFTVRSMLRG
ncbi:hypothetical protein DIPPA_20931 [Diplonema papillatum]|nr:hypothetical protein DIPPA_20931 [Diplonema papillatum]